MLQPICVELPSICIQTSPHQGASLRSLLSPDPNLPWSYEAARTWVTSTQTPIWTVTVFPRTITQRTLCPAPQLTQRHRFSSPFTPTRPRYRARLQAKDRAKRGPAPLSRARSPRDDLDTWGTSSPWHPHGWKTRPCCFPGHGPKTGSVTVQHHAPPARDTGTPALASWALSGTGLTTRRQLGAHR